MQNINLQDINNIFFIGVAGSGMSAIAQYLAAKGKNISGSDRQFSGLSQSIVYQQLTLSGVKCFPQDGSGINQGIEMVVISTAIEATNIEIQKAQLLGINIVKRSEILATISREAYTIAVAGTSGKSTTVAMLYHILEQNGKSPSLMTGAGLNSLKKKGLIGNAAVGNSNILIIEADESDGSIVNYSPEIGIVLNIDKDHKAIDELMELFKIFKQNTKSKFIVNLDNVNSCILSSCKDNDFSTKSNSGFYGTNFEQKGFCISFIVKDVRFEIPVIGAHNMENALAAIAAAYGIGVSVEESACALKTFEGLDRRQTLIGEKNGILFIDDFAHNPVKIREAIRACQPLGKRLIAWFQPHGYAPVRFLKEDYIAEISSVLRTYDEIIMPEIYYVGGTVTKDISANNLIEGIKQNGLIATYMPDRQELALYLKSKLREGEVMLFMGARDPSLGDFAKKVFDSF